MPAIATTPHAPVLTGRAPRGGVVVLLVVTALIVLTQLYVSIPLQEPVGAEFGPAGVTAALTAGYSFFYAVGFLVYGPLSDHLGRRRVLVSGLAVLTMATVAVGLAPSPAALGVLRAVQGAAAATFAPTALAYLGEALPPRRRTGAIGAISVAFLAAGIVGQVAATAIGAAGWRWVFFLGGLALAVLTLISAAMIREPAAERPRQPLPSRYASLVRFTVRPRSLVLCAGHLVVLGGFVGMYTLLGPHLADAGLSSAETMPVRAAALPAMFCSLLAGPLSDRFGVTRSALIGFVVAALGLAGEAVLGGNLIGVTAASVVFVAGVAILVPTMITVWGDAAHPARGIGMAVNGFVLFLGAGLGSYATELPGGFSTALLILAALYLAAGIVISAATGRTRPAR
ncbi:MFS transporter [Nonomuraea sp. SBT364]|uniref:MFS transporter n=1 Tax=Nonomuraea sp. SBT364 TaxID=1580530 RepID=UPI00069E31C4|nr:MFS transporter [Nonomuraea sp. SBT364]